MKEIKISGRKRTSLGKKASKELRKEGLVPCNIYGIAQKDGAPVAVQFAVPMVEMRKVVYTPHTYVINLDIEGEEHTAILKELQFDPITDAVLHVDFLEVNDEKPIAIGIPIRLNGLAAGVRNGGRMNLSLRKITVKAPYQSIPEHLDIDVTNLQIGKSIKVGDLNYEGITIVTPKDVVVCSVKMTRNASSSAGETSLEDEKEEGAEGQTGEGESADSGEAGGK